MARLAREIAMDIREHHVVIKEYGINQNQYDFLLETPFFKRALDTAILEWNSAASTPERMRLEAAAILEDALPHLGARMQRLSEGLPGIVEAGKLFAKIAGLDTPNKDTAAPGERFRITINLGGDIVQHTSKPHEPRDITPSRSAGTIQIDGEG